MVEPVPPLGTVKVPRLKVLGFVPEQVRKPPGHEFEITPEFVTVRAEPFMRYPGVPEKLIPVPEEIVLVATLATVETPVA